MSIQFRIHPESTRGFYFDVKVFPTKKAMREYAVTEKGGSAYFRKAEAATLGMYRTDKRARPTKFLGACIFHEKALTPEIIAHEATHAAIRWAQATQIQPVPEELKDGNSSDDEERFCYVVGRLTEQIAVKCAVALGHITE